MNIDFTVSSKRLRLIALLQVKNEERFLPGMLRNIEPFVDGVVALDDGSDDRTYEILASNNKVLEILRNEPSGNPWDEHHNQVSLVLAGRRHAADWFLCLDADERLERQFGFLWLSLLSRAECEGVQAYAFHFRELWNDPHHYRVDGIWGQKTKWVLFKNVPSHSRWDPRKHHRYWIPLEIAENLAVVGRHSGLNIYHLRMMRIEDRQSRARRWEMLDHNHDWQPIGYDYMLDETGLALEAIEPGREFAPLE